MNTLACVVLIVAAYYVSLVIHPYVTCPKCRRADRGGYRFGSVFVYRRRSCRHCGGSRRCLRLGVLLLSGAWRDWVESAWAVWVCRQLVAGAVRVLPAGHRARYAAEWQAELWELGQQPRRRRHQLGHAVRLLSQCVALRRGLTEPVPGRAAGAGSDG